MYRWIDHVSEVEVAIEAPSAPRVFVDALAAFAELAGDDRRTADERREIALEAHDLPALLAEWLDELVYLADAQQFVPDDVDEIQLDDGHLRAVVRGHRGEPRTLVKAVTRHRLAFEPSEGGGWHARVVLDV